MNLQRWGQKRSRSQPSTVQVNKLAHNRNRWRGDRNLASKLKKKGRSHVSIAISFITSHAFNITGFSSFITTQLGCTCKFPSLNSWFVCLFFFPRSKQKSEFSFSLLRWYKLHLPGAHFFVWLEIIFHTKIYYCINSNYNNVHYNV